MASAPPHTKWKVAATKAKQGRGSKLSFLGKWRQNGMRQTIDLGEDGLEEVRKNQGRMEEGTGKKERPNKTGWREHVWSTFIHRGFPDDVTDTVRNNV